MLDKIFIPKRRQSKLSPNTDDPTGSTKKPRTGTNPATEGHPVLATSSATVTTGSLLDGTDGTSLAGQHASPQHSSLSLQDQTGGDETGSGEVDPDPGQGPVQDTLPKQEREGNPSTFALKPKTCNSAWRGLEKAMRALHITAEVIPPVQSAVGALVSCLNHFETAHTNQEGYNEVILELSTISEFLSRHLQAPRSQGLTRRISNIAKVVDTEIQEVRKLQGQSRPKQVLEAADCEADLARRFRRIGDLFRCIQMEASMSEWSITNEIMVNNLLDKLTPASLARYNSRIADAIGRRACTEDTRQDTLSEAEEWYNNPNSPMIFWVDGMAGTGKTTIAYTLTQRLELCGQLAASFFCTITSEECRKASSIIPTIAYQLSQRSTPFKAALGEVLKFDSEAPMLSIQEQMERLLIGPLNSVKGKMAHNLIVVVDALDECNDTSVVRIVLSSLINSAGRLPLRFFITSRPEPAIYNQLIASSSDIRSVLHLHEVSYDSVRRDIRAYLKEGLKPIEPSEYELTQLTLLSDRLFIYAATAIRYIIPENLSVDSRARLRTMLEARSKSTKKHSAIDALYTAILSTAIDNDALEPHERESILSVMWAVVCSDDPMKLHGLSVIAGVSDKEAALTALGPLRSVLHLSETTETVSTFHASFSQFILDQSRSGSFYCNEARTRERSAMGCMKVFKSELCHLVDPNATPSPYFKFAGLLWVHYLIQDKCWTDRFPEEACAELRGVVNELIQLREWLDSMPTRGSRTIQALYQLKYQYLNCLKRLAPLDLHKDIPSAVDLQVHIEDLIRNQL